MSALAVMFVVGGAIAATTPAAAQGVSLGGRWATQGFGSIVDMQPCTGYPTAVCGRIVWLREAVDVSGRPRVDGRNPNRALRQRPLIGVEIIRGFRETSPDVWTGGRLYNPDDGRNYTGEIRLRDRTLHLQGCALRVFCQTQVWRRASDLTPTEQEN